MSNMRDAAAGYVKRVGELGDYVEGNEEGTKQILVEPLFTMLGYDVTNARECLREERWAFAIDGAVAFFVGVVALGKELPALDELLAGAFASAPTVKLAILTNGAQWRFFTDAVEVNVMDKEPFARWDIVANDAPPLELLTLLQRSHFDAEAVRAYALRQRRQQLLVRELTSLLEGSPEFAKLAIANLETRPLTPAVIEGWRPVMAAAVDEWARQRALASAVAAGAPSSGRRGEPTQAQIEAFDALRAILGSHPPAAYDDPVAYFKVHLGADRRWVCTRLQLSRIDPPAWVPLPPTYVAPFSQAPPTPRRATWTPPAPDSSSEISEQGISSQRLTSR